MRTVMILSGYGALKDAGAPLGHADYTITVFEDARGKRSGSGHIRSDDIMLLLKAFDVRTLTVSRQDTGVDVRIIVTHYRAGDQTAPIKLSGSVGE